MNKILAEYLKIDKSILKIVKQGIKYCFAFSIFSTSILLIYDLYSIPNLYYIGISLFKSSMFYIVSFIAFGYAFNILKNETN